jgi:DNA-binding beta-propeller fold protein YncE
VATPGPQRPWVAEAGAGRLLGITPDARRIGIVRSGFDRPSVVAVDSGSGRVWFSDPFAGRVTSIDPGSGAVVSITGLVSPGALAAEPLRQSVWVCDEQNDVVQEFSASGTPLGAPIESVLTPIGIAIAAWDRSLWICERGADQLRRYDANRSLMWSIALPGPSRVATDSLAERAWVTSFGSGQVHRISPLGTVELTLPGFGGPIGLAVDARRGHIWITEALADQITVIDRSGAVLFRVPGLSETRDVAVDRETGEAWAVAPGSGEVVKIASDGRVVRRLSGLNGPFGIALDSGRP